MKRSTFVLLLFLCLSQLGAQNLRPEISLSADYYIVDIKPYRTEVNSRSVTYLNDTTLIYTSGVRYYLYESKLDSTLSPELKFQFNKNLSSRLSINFGMGMNYYSYRKHRNTIDSEFVPNGIVDTVIYNISAGNNPPSLYSSCDQVLNSYSDVNIPDKLPSHKIFNLIVPLSTEFEVLDDFLWYGVGVTLISPLAFRKRTFKVSYDREVINGETICSYSLNEELIKSASGFNPMLLDINSYISFKLRSSLFLDMTFSKLLISPFSEDSISWLDASATHTPLSVGLGLTYRFNTLKGE